MLKYRPWTKQVTTKMTPIKEVNELIARTHFAVYFLFSVLLRCDLYNSNAKSKLRFKIADMFYFIRAHLFFSIIILLHCHFFVLSLLFVCIVLLAPARGTNNPPVL